MTFSKHFTQPSTPIIHDIYNHPFIQHLLPPNLSNQPLTQYLTPHASYLKHFTNIYPILIPKITSIQHLKFLLQQI
ncbi:thiaminase II/PqqC family protein, partial [Staphylococcus epidermidis]